MKDKSIGSIYLTTSVGHLAASGKDSSSVAKRPVEPAPGKMSNSEVFKSLLKTAKFNLAENKSNKNLFSQSFGSLKVNAYTDGGKLTEVTRGKSPFDLLDEMFVQGELTSEDVDAARSLFLRPNNENAPPNYRKPEACHGTAWGLEVLMEGKLRGPGKLQPKSGGGNAMYGKVFFTDRSVGKLNATGKIDHEVRTGARDHIVGSLDKPENQISRGFQYMMMRWMRHNPDALKSTIKLGSSKELDLKELLRKAKVSPKVLDVRLKEEQEKLRKIHQEGRGAQIPLVYIEKFLSSELHRVLGANKEKFDGSPEKSWLSTELPDELIIEGETLKGEALQNMYMKVVQRFTDSCEKRDDSENPPRLPLLGVVNKGKPVPIVFGFDKIPNNENNTFNEGARHKLWPYKDVDHSLAGDENGRGKLKEIEVNNLEDLATLSLALRAQNKNIPNGVVIRIRGKKADIEQNEKLVRCAKISRATYLTPDKLHAFQEKLWANSPNIGNGIGDIADLQESNDQLRKYVRLQGDNLIS